MRRLCRNLVAELRMTARNEPFPVFLTQIVVSVLFVTCIIACLAFAVWGAAYVVWFLVTIAWYLPFAIAAAIAIWAGASYLLYRHYRNGQI